MPANIVTTEDLQKFKEDILREFKELLITYDKITIDNWIKSSEVMLKLGISPGTLQNFRVNGTLPYTKLGGIIYYDVDEINRMMLEKKVNGFRNLKKAS